MNSASLVVSTAVLKQAIDNGSAAVALKTVAQARELAEQFGEQAMAKAVAGNGVGASVDINT